MDAINEIDLADIYKTYVRGFACLFVSQCFVWTFPLFSL